MHTSIKKLSAGMLALALLFAITTSANAQSRFGGRLSTKEKAAYIGGGAVAGAVIGGLLGGKKGAVIGGLLGAGGGTGVVYLKGRRDEDRYGRYYGYRDSRYWDDHRRDRDWRDRDRDDRNFRDRWSWSHNRFRR
ncbi:MAG TPA: hypothetical protein VLM38_07485 [Blastocatellia bacterium]|nr:hypothetical protein [Blastocatellia bacterium]